ncbi:MAG TPA: indolepyruvate oxidoreductase subunit beta [Syntrophales bacterium]|jgi:indolepyruvate ferredoxin oxidoreductase beta subunit|nr:indolepyruvate oxidoreductase subunit beta [Syntrophales bacterium]HRT61397.1 indolepyruvate oxidoreductase subunit beta [Syntrophales bacterium]
MTTNSVTSLLLAGVGGQGVLLASDIIGKVMMRAGLDVKKSEVHGMAQRGGCVTSHVRYGRKVYSPIAKEGDVDILVAFEKLETLRYLNLLRTGAKIIINEEEIYPPSVNLGDAAYPVDAAEIVKRRFKDVLILNAPELARKAGNVRAVSTVMLGALSRYLTGVTPEDWKNVIAEEFAEKLVPANLKAFDLGREAV